MEIERSEFVALARSWGISGELAEAAASHLLSGDLVLLGLNGKLASGKDSVAPAVMEALGVSDARHLYYALALKDEVDEVITSIRLAETPAEAVAAVAGTQNVPTAVGLRVVSELWSPTRAGERLLTSRDRTVEMRSVLQYWGTEVRRSQDPEYWVRKALVPAVEAMAGGHSVFFTDVRFVNEVVGAQRLGFCVARLNVSAATQRARLRARDGLEPSASALGHVSETALDAYTGFDLIIDNDGPMAPTVEALCSHLRPSAVLRRAG